MAEILYIEDGIIQCYRDITGWFWWDNELNGWSNDKDKFEKKLK